MSSDDHKPTPRTAALTAELWKRMLRNPTFDIDAPGRLSETGMITNYFKAKMPHEVTEEGLTRFASELETAIQTADKDGWHSNRLGVDYGPDGVLKMAADVAGLTCIQFPLKTNTNTYRNFVTCANGYGRPWVYYYVMPDDLWLVTTLTGTDAAIEAIKQLAVSGVFCDAWKIERSPCREIVEPEAIEPEAEAPVAVPLEAPQPGTQWQIVLISVAILGVAAALIWILT